MINDRRKILRLLLANAALAGTSAFVRVRADSSTAPADDNLPDPSTYETIRFPEREPDIDYAKWYANCDAMTAAAREDLPHFLNLPFGPHFKQRLDLYLPQQTSAARAPVMLFFHGGGFEEGHRAHYGYVAVPYAAHGIITAVVGYRLVPDGFHYPSQVEDVQKSLMWIYRNIADYGGDPNALFLTGHSVGATLSAEVGGDRTWTHAAGIPSAALRGIGAISGNYDWIRNPMDGQGAYYAPTRELQRRASALEHVKNPVPQTIVTQGTTEAYERAWTKNSPDYVAALRAHGAKADLIVLSTGHLGTLADFATAGTRTSQAVIAMIEKRAD